MKLECFDGTSWSNFATESYADAAASKAVSLLRLDTIGSPLGTVNMNNQRLTGLANPSLSSDATSKTYVDSKTWDTSQILNFNSAVTAFRLDQFAKPTASIDLNNNRVLNVAAPTAATDGANKQYIDSKIFDINANTSGQLSISRIQNYPNNSNQVLFGNGTWRYLNSNSSYYIYPAIGGYASDHLIFKNSNGGIGAGIYNGVVYGKSGSNLLEVFNDATLKASIDSSGAYTTVSDRSFKHSIVKKTISDKDYLSRILNLNIYSFCQMNANDVHQHHNLSIGVMYDEVESLFNGNCLNKRKLKDEFNCENKSCPHCHPKQKAVISADIFYYHILAFQSFYHQQYLPLKDKLEHLEKSLKNFKN